MATAGSCAGAHDGRTLGSVVKDRRRTGRSACPGCSMGRAEGCGEERWIRLSLREMRSEQPP